MSRVDNEQKAREQFAKLFQPAPKQQPQPSVTQQASRKVWKVQR